MRLNLFQLIIITILIFQSVIAYSQVQEKKDEIKLSSKNGFCVTIFGPAAFYSLNYQRQLISNSKFKTLADVGIAYYPRGLPVFELWFPLSIIENIKIYKRHSINLGIGQTFIHDNNGPEYYSLGWASATNFIIGYRFQNKNQRFFEEANYVGIIAPYSNFGHELIN